MTVVHSKYSAINRLVMNREKFYTLEAAELTSIKDKVAELKRLEVEIFKIIVGMDNLY